MSNKSSRTPAALVLNISPSRRLRTIYFLLSLLALFAVACSGFALLLQIALAIAVLIYTALLLRRKYPSRLRFDAGWFWQAQQDELALQLQQATVWPMLIVLRFRDPQYSRLNWRGSHALILLRDNLSVNDWRHLRIYLNHFSVYGDLAIDNNYLGSDKRPT